MSNVMPQESSSRGSRVALGIGALFFVVGCIGAIGSWSAYRLDNSIEKSGQRAEGRITKKSVLFVADGDSDFIVEYWFNLPSGKRVEAVRGVDKKLWNTLRDGEAFVVLYSAESPKRNFPSGGGVTSIGVTVFASVFFGVFAVFGALLVAGFIRGKRTEA